MILIADSGSTKTDWCVVENGQLIRQIFTKGTNPFFQSEEEISNEIATALLPRLTTDALDAVYFYGAGCGFPDKIAMVHRAITKHLRVKGEVEVNTDMLAAARGLCQHDAGIACIMGTGSNSCYYDGKQIVSNVSPLGFILGDEGSGAVLGKLLVGDILKNQMPPELKEKFLTQFNLTPADIIDRVYRKSPRSATAPVSARTPTVFWKASLHSLHRTWTNPAYAHWYRTASRHSSNVT